jgi:hypothetical protein
MIAAITDFASQNLTSRSDAIRQLIAAGLSAIGAIPAKLPRVGRSAKRES